MDDKTQKAIERIEKLMRLANSPAATPAEAANALARSQEMLAAYNLDMVTVEAAGGAEGKRTDERTSGGGYAWQRRLWKHIAELNFCMYWTMKVRVKPGSYAEKRNRTYTAEHRLVGRIVNVTQTKNMASYITQAIHRLRRERGLDQRSSEAVAFMEGVADAIIEKVIARREKAEEQERSKAAEEARRAAAAGVSLSTAITLASFKERESDANYDHIHGEGASARRRKEQAEWEQERAEAQRIAEENWTRWCLEHPEEAAEMEREKRKKREQAAKRRARSGSGYGRYRYRETKEEQRQGSSAYHHGFADGQKVSIDPQASDGRERRISHG